jgi:hypothetical protein
MKDQWTYDWPSGEWRYGDDGDGDYKLWADDPKPPYPFCHFPEKCAAAGRCTKEWVCND